MDVVGYREHFRMAGDDDAWVYRTSRLISEKKRSAMLLEAGCSMPNMTLTLNVMCRPREVPLHDILGLPSSRGVMAFNEERAMLSMH
jgi:hypothetical protein